MKRKFLSVLLIWCMVVTLLPTTSLALSEEVQYVKGELTIGFDCYAVFSYGGETLRSDELTTTFNAQLWEKLSDADKLQLMKDFAIYYEDLRAQFGNANAKAMCDWVNDFTGWTDARALWSARVAARNYPTLTDYFTKGEGKEGIKDYLQLNTASDTLPEAIAYRNLYNLFEQWYIVGERSTERLATFSVKATSLAVASTSGELVKLIMDNALLGKPSLSLSENIKDQLWNYTDQLIDIKDSMIEWAVGDDMLTPEKAVTMIEQLNRGMAVQEQIANTAMSRCTSLRTDLDAAYEVFVTANAAYIEAGDERENDIKNDTNTLINAGVIPTQPTITPEQVYQSVLTAFNNAVTVYNDWSSPIAAAKADVANAVSANLKVYEWPKDVDMNTLPDLDPEAMLHTYEGYFNFCDAIETSVAAAQECCSNNISAWTNYQEACENLLDVRMGEYKDSVEPALEGVAAYIQNSIIEGDANYDSYRNMYNNIGTKLNAGEALLKDVAAMQLSGSFALEGGHVAKFKGTVQTAIDEENRQIEQLTKNLAAWKENAETALYQAEKDAEEYLIYQKQYEQAIAEMLEQDNEFKRLENELNGLDWYAAQGFDPLGFLQAPSASQPLNSILDPLFKNDNFRVKDPNGSTHIDWDARNRLLRSYADILQGYYSDMRQAAAALSDARDRRDICADIMCQLSGSPTGSTNIYLDNLHDLDSKIKSTGKILTAFGETDMARIVNMAVPGESSYTKLNIIMRDLYGFSYDYMRLRGIVSEFEAERADIMRLDNAGFEDRLTHYNNRANFRNASTNPQYQATPFVMAPQRSFTPAVVSGYYYKHFLPEESGGDGVTSDMREKRAAGFVPADGLSGLGASSMQLMADDDVYDLPLAVDASYDLSQQIYVLPYNATERDIYWSSSDYRVASVNANGIVTGVSDGLVTISAIAYDTPSTNNEAFTKTVVFKVGEGTPEPGWHISAPEINVNEADGTVSATTSLRFVGEGGEDLYCVLALYHNGRMLAVDTCRADFDLLPDNSVQNLTVSSGLPSEASGGFSAKVFRMNPLSLSPRHEAVNN